MNNGISCEEKNYKNFGKCLFVSDGSVNIIASLEFGIRILALFKSGGENLFYEQEKDSSYLCTKEGWRIYGGHRLAFAPESEKTYWPDNAPVRYTVLNNCIRLEQEEDGYLNIAKSMEISFTGNPCELSVVHRISNTGSRELTGAPWAITAMAGGGSMILPWDPPESFTEAPNRFVSIWNSTSLSDPRLSFADEYIEIKQLPVDNYFKMGFYSPKGTIRYKNKGCEFIKTTALEKNKNYPDNNVNLEVFSCRHMMEIETLAALRSLKPGESCEHRELWSIK